LELVVVTTEGGGREEGEGRWGDEDGDNDGDMDMTETTNIGLPK
jgi:hypothetical protein